MSPPLPAGFRPAEPAPGMTYTPPEQFPFVSITWKKGTMILEKGPLLGRTTAPSLRLMKTNEHYLNLFQQFPVPALGGRAVTLCLLPWGIRTSWLSLPGSPQESRLAAVCTGTGLCCIPYELLSPVPIAGFAGGPALKSLLRTVLCGVEEEFGLCQEGSSQRRLHVTPGTTGKVLNPKRQIV